MIRSPPPLRPKAGSNETDPGILTRDSSKRCVGTDSNRGREACLQAGGQDACPELETSASDREGGCGAAPEGGSGCGQAHRGSSPVGDGEGGRSSCRSRYVA